MNKGILFIVLLATVAIVVTGCAQNSPLYSSRTSAVTNPFGGGGSSGGEYIECYTDDDCGTSTAYNYCEGNVACSSQTNYPCTNPGTPQSDCPGGSSVVECGVCDYGCYNGACIDDPNPQTEITYMDPTSCESIFIENYNGTQNYTTVLCEDNQFVGEVTFINCPDRRDERIVTETSHFGNSLPYEISYSCVNYETGWLRTPHWIRAYCCNIENAQTQRGNEHRIVLNEDGTVTET